MIQPHATIRLAPDEWVLYVTEPSLDMKAHWIRVTAGTIIGLLLFILPGIIILAVGIINGLSTRSNLQERYGSAQCVVTSKRLIASGWGQRRRLVEFEHHRITRMTSSGLLARGAAGRQVGDHSERRRPEGQTPPPARP